MNITQFLDAHNIPYLDHGRNVGRGHIAIKCPFCTDDPSEHLNINLANGYWNCLRASGRHSGRTLHRLICKLISCSYEEADNIISQDADLDTFGDTIRRLMTKSAKPNSKSKLELPKEFRPLTTKGSGLYYTDYLIYKRRFRPKDIPILTNDYNLHFCTSGFWRRRIIFPLFFERRLVCWTGRTISSRIDLRYLSLNEENRALLSPKNIVWNYDGLLRGGAALVITEGPLDALKVDLYGRKAGVRATCLFGTGVTEDQIALLSELRDNFQDFILLGDRGTRFSNVWHLKDLLSELDPRIADLPKDVGDPGDLTPLQAEALARKLKGEIKWPEEGSSNLRDTSKLGDSRI